MKPGDGHVRRPRAARSRRGVAIVTLSALLTLAAPAAADEYDPERAGHPVRIAAYILHPIGVTLDYLVFRPAHWLGHQEPFRTLFGHRHEGR